jgi:hypothetical protein
MQPPLDLVAAVQKVVYIGAFAGALIYISYQSSPFELESKWLICNTAVLQLATTLTLVGFKPLIGNNKSKFCLSHFST